VARAITGTLVWKTLTIYATHEARGEGEGEGEGTRRYYTTQLCSFALDHDVETCRKGMEALRNAIEWAEEERMEAVGMANRRAYAAAAVKDPPESPGSFASTETTV